MSDDYSATHGLMMFLLATNNGAAEGTGIRLNVDQAHNLLGKHISPVLVNYTLGTQINLFGSYPDESDVVPSAIFTAVFAILGILHLIIFCINFSRGHYFWLSMGWFGYCITRVVGWALRIAWARNITVTQMGIANEVFLIIPSIILVSINLILAQRLFTWRHPVGGSRKLFWSIMIGLYIVVLGVIAMTIVASAIPYLYYLSEKTYKSYQKVVQASAILIILYTLTAVSLIALSYFFKPTRKDENLYTYQPWWIESFHPFYFVRPHAAQEAEETFMKRNRNHRHAIRVIAATHHHYKIVEGLSNERGNLKHNTSLLIICLSTLFLFVGSVLRAVAVFQAKFNRDEGPVCDPVAMYIMWGLLETVINLSYIIGRVDLRFYRPDVLPAAVRAIITAEQTTHPSVMPSPSEQATLDGDNMSLDQSEFDFSDSESLPPNYYENKHEKQEVVTDDNESEFYF
ncbi:uncharacterized protein AC631_02935 [Debaryomyces fabryi]|uniref:Uncharacterized protein n=1 Tax=Debaryomyces fabryi TaxID=58627 RepID=A0A0V1PYI1_9ASCO|nr:uncharacterized protein AC631_02935 [Debaryomyces fabryi]KSA01303.1 hypothetical protein AC631_02935 [Debaryomyces fabryi]CUM46981.1 unnamed protein product [Debaryomyces fabryi]